MACTSEAAFLIRAHQDRKVNKESLYSENSGENLWELLRCSPCQGEIKLNIPARDSQPHRIATLEVRFSNFTMNPPQNNIEHKTRKLPNLQLNAIHVIETDPPVGQEPMNWMLLTNLDVNNFEEAAEKIQWYCLRWRIETFHKILKSGLKVETCRLGTADRLGRFLSLMSVIGWRIFYITMIAREAPDASCDSVLAEGEWKVLYAKIHHTKEYPDRPPTIKEAVRWIAQLGGFLARKSDGEPGPITLWRGWKRLIDLSEGWNLAHKRDP